MKTTTILRLAFSVTIGMDLGWARQDGSLAVPPAIPKNQSVAIYFERFDEQKGMVWLRLHNWTAWDIRVPVEISSLDIVNSAKTHKDGAEVSVRYYLEEYAPGPWMQITTASGQKDPPDEPEHPAVPKIHRVDFFTEWWIPKNQSITFQVPKEHLARNIALYVYLRYEWESLGVEVLDGPVHLVYFRGLGLPPEVQKKIR